MSDMKVECEGTKVPKILVTGITSLRLNAMEFDNLGNFIIIEPLFRSLRAKFPQSSIQTTLQLSDEFADLHSVKVLGSSCFWEYKLFNTVKILLDLLLLLVLRALSACKINLQSKVHYSDRLTAIIQNDIIIDFSGDMYGDNALNWHQFLVGTINPILAKLLYKKTFFVASSPGPFKTIMSLFLAKLSLKFYDIVSVREPVSLEILNGVGLVGEKFCCHPCFSYGFNPTGALSDERIIAQEPSLSFNDKPMVGLILCNLNMVSPPANKWPREDHEYRPFIELVSSLVREQNVRVCIFSHRNKTDAGGRIVTGSDHDIINRLIELLPDGIEENVFTLNGIYDAPTMNKIISRFAMLVSGRIHGAVQGIMQYIPTVIIDYGMEPRAHKLRGFALLCGLYDYVCDPADIGNLKSKVRQVWEQRQRISEDLKNRIPENIYKSQQIWDVVEDIYQGHQ